MENFSTITLDEAIALMQRRPGLLIGPTATRAVGDLTNVLQQAARTLKIEELCKGIDEGNYGAFVDKVRSERNDKASGFESKIKEGIVSFRAAPDINHLAKALWSGCISATEDLTFEGAIRTHLDSLPASRTLTIIDEIRVTPPGRTIPVYKLLGNVMSASAEAALVLSEGDMLLRQNIWRDLLSTFSDYVRDAPIFVIGLSSKIPLARAVIGALQSMPHPRPTQLLFLKNDPTLSDPTVIGLCKRFKTYIVDASLRDLSAKISGLRLPDAKSSSAPVAASLVDIAGLVRKHSSVMLLAPGSVGAVPMSQMEQPHVVEALFRPAATDWRPFQHGFDVRRSITDKILPALNSLAKDSAPGSSRVLLLHGEAGVGKTTLLKRLAMEASDAGLVCLWCTRSSSGSALRGLKALAKELSDWAKNQKPQTNRFAIFCDDPWGLRLDVGDLSNAFDGFPAPLVFVLSVRNTDYGAIDTQTIQGSISVDLEIEIPYELDSDELVGLAKTMVSIGAVADISGATREISRVPTRHASDILCNLWYLIPETRMQFAESLRDEYCRLGSVRDAVGNLAAKSMSEGGAIAHGAYEFVTVTSNLNVGLPVEVLVRALGVDYSDWLETVGPSRPLWGLLYDVQDDESETVTYFTRNEIVTKLLLELVNGPVGHAGEFGVLKRLLGACSGGSMVYRTFALNVLVRGRKRLAEFLTYEQGIELFDIASKVLPFEDRVIEHHRGIWMQDVGKADGAAYKQFEKALSTDIYPGSDRDAPKEHIHTSMAAATLKLIRSGEQELELGMSVIKEHLRQASSSRFFNPHTSHVSASVLFEVAKLSGLASSKESAFSYVVSALQEIERARQVVGSRREIRLQKDLEMMADLEKRVLSSIPDSSTLEELAFKIFETSGSQVGFEVASRRMLVEASASSKGKDFNEVHEFLNRCMEALDKKPIQPTTDLILVRIDLFIRWTILGFRPVPWKDLREDLAGILKDPRYRDDVMRTFYYAVTLYHCSEITEANAVFAALRRWQPAAFGLREIRCYFLGSDGSPRRFQGVFRSENHRWFFEIPELNVALLSRAPQSYGSGATGHAYISFALNGPLVQEGRPDKSDLTFW